MTMITPSYLGETIEYSSLHACRSTLEDPTCAVGRWRKEDCPKAVKFASLSDRSGANIHGRPSVRLPSYCLKAH